MRHRSAAIISVLAATAVALAGCSSADSASAGGRPELKVTESFMPEPVGGSGMAAGFVTIANSGSAADKLISVTSSLSNDITLHTTKNQQMREVTSLPVPAHGELDLERGGNHVMFMHLKNQPERGGEVAIQLHFEKSGTLSAELPVKEPTYDPKHGLRD